MAASIRQVKRCVDYLGVMRGAQSPEFVGSGLREWRKRRRLSQLDLALEAGISARHLSFVETGRSKPGRAMLLQILRHLDVPFREQNRLLLAAGYAPALPERSLEGTELAPVREALSEILTRHEPYPAIIVDRRWNVVGANSAATALTRAARVDPALLEPPVNALRIGLHPRGLAPLLVDSPRWRAHFRERLERQLAATGDAGLAALLQEIDRYSEFDRDAAREVMGPLRLRVDGAELSFLGMFATFDTPFDVTTSELAAELLFPADGATAESLRANGVPAARQPPGRG